MPLTLTTQWLRERAESYSRDARTLTEDGDTPMAAAYWVIAEHLRTCADKMDQGEFEPT